MIEMCEVGEVILFDQTCAWCLKEQGLLTAEHQQEGDSHGICKFHDELERMKLQFHRVKPFVERYRRTR